MPASQKGLTSLVVLVLVILGIGLGFYFLRNWEVSNSKTSGNTQQEQMTLKESPSPEASASAGLPIELTASPNPCVVGAKGLCTAKIKWNSAYPDLTITIRENPGSLFAQAPYGSQDAPWISEMGATFDAYSGDKLVGSLFVKGIKK